ncbi:hypothetical protein N9176_01220 [bacterium]|nr:hypothetical protein [bacterium]
MKNEPEVIKKTQPPKTKIEKVNDHNLRLIKQQYELKMLTKKLEFSLHNIERKSSIESMWNKELSYIVNKNYIAQIKNEISKSKNSLQKSMEKWQDISDSIDTTGNDQSAKLQEIKKLIEELEVEIEKTSKNLER